MVILLVFMFSCKIIIIVVFGVVKLPHLYYFYQ